jgi:hypothetical protein
MLGDEDDGTFLQDIENVQSNQFEIQRLRSLYDEAAQDYSKKANQLNEYSIVAANDRVSFFEKVAIGAGACIAAIVSFLGAKTHPLEPRWVLRASLISLASALFAALLRNYLYPFYLFAARQVQFSKAYREREKRKALCVKAMPVNLNWDTGEQIDPKTFLIDWEQDDKQSASAIETFQKREARYFRGWKWSEVACLGAVVASSVWLVLLVWWNF